MVMSACAASAFAADVQGTIEVGVRGGNVKGNQAKHNEYRDLRKALTLGFDLGLSEKDYYTELSGQNLGLSIEADSRRQSRDQSLLLEGGKYEAFKYSLFYDEIPHNTTYGASALYPGAGTSVLGTAPVTSTATTIALNNAQKYAFDYAIGRKNYGASAEVSLNSPFFFSARAERNETKGTIPLGTYLGQIKEVPLPVDYETDNLYLETGYRAKNLIATIDGTLSRFHENTPTQILAFTNASQYLTVPPSNDYFKIGGSVKYDIPLIKSTLMVRGSYSKLTSEFNLFDPAAAVAAGAGNFTHFKGELDYTTASAALTSRPIENLDTRLFVNYLDKNNESNTGFSYRTNNTAAALLTGVTEGFEYHKINGGLDLGYKLPARTKVSTGYEYQKLERALRNDAPETVDHSAYLQVKNDLLHWMGAKVRYQFLDRISDFMQPVNPAGPGGQSEGYFRPADAATKMQHTVKVGLDFEPLDSVTLGLEYAYKYADFRDSVLGVQSEKSHGIYFDSNVTVGIFRFNPYADFELADQVSSHHFGAGTAVLAPSSATSYNWTNSAENTYYAVGINSEIEVIKEKLVASIGARYEKSDGAERFATDSPGLSATGQIFDNNAVDDYKKKMVCGKLTAKFSKELKGTVGYTFEKLSYADDHYTGYNNYPLAGYALTGAYNNPNYTAHVGFVTMAYSF